MALGVLFGIITNNIYLIAGGMFVFEAGMTIYFRSTTSIIQILVPKEQLGSWFAAIDSMCQFLGIVGILGAAWAFSYFGVFYLDVFLILILLLTSLIWLTKQSLEAGE